jgi:hypothetical protein
MLLSHDGRPNSLTHPRLGPKKEKKLIECFSLKQMLLRELIGAFGVRRRDARNLIVQSSTIV